MKDFTDVEVHYIVHVPTKIVERIAKEAGEDGHSYNDAGPIETIRRYLLCEGMGNAFPESQYGLIQYTRK